MPDHAHQTANALFDLIPPAIAPDFLNEYGIDTDARHAQAVTVMLLSLTTYWIADALRVSIPEPLRGRMHRVIQDRIRDKWGSRFGLVHVPVEPTLAVIEQRHQTWERLTRRGGPPLAVLQDAAARLADDAASSLDDRNILAVLLDLAPIDAIGEHVAELEHSLRPPI